MILTLTPNPSLDRTIELASLERGERWAWCYADGEFFDEV